YTEKYIDSVYFEKDSILYRSADAPKWYLPENVFDPYNVYGSFRGGNGRSDFIVKEKFHDNTTGESFTHDIAVSCDYSWVDDEEEGLIYKYHGIYIASELPIREQSSSEMFDEIIKPVIEKKKNELDISDGPFGVTDIYSGTMFDYNNDGHDDYVIAYGLYAQFQLVIINSQNGDILFDNRIMTHLVPSTGLEIYRNDNSEYAFKITLRNEKPVVSSIDETIQIITASEECIFEAVYDYETGNFYSGYGNYNSDNEYTQEEYIQKQEELLNGYKHYANTEWSQY
ncbi:MAG: hypothetical protein K2N71_10595, partial [Oscillospiraceae bacterium]|nr:hypothetical protein [Oscillospiraceae bacterium]